MALKATFKDTKFGVGDRVKVKTSFKEQGKKRSHTFDGIVIGIKGREKNKSFTVRRMGVGQIGIEKIIPLHSPSIEDIEIVREGTEGVRHSKLYFIRDKSKKEIEKIYSRASKRQKSREASEKKKTSKAKKKK